MKRRLLPLTLLLACAALGLPPSTSYAAYVVRVNVDADKSVTVGRLSGVPTSPMLSVAVDCCVVHSGSMGGSIVAVHDVTASVGQHTIAVQVLERSRQRVYDPTISVSTDE